MPATAPDWTAYWNDLMNGGAVSAAVPPEPAAPAPRPLSEARVRDLDNILRGHSGLVDKGMQRRLRQAALIEDRADEDTHGWKRVQATEAACEAMLAAVLRADPPRLPPLPLGTRFYVAVVDAAGGRVAVEERVTRRRYPVAVSRQIDGDWVRETFVCHVDLEGHGFIDARGAPEASEVFAIPVGFGSEQRPRPVECGFNVLLARPTVGRSQRVFLSRQAARQALLPVVERLRAACAAFLDG